MSDSVGKKVAQININTKEIMTIFNSIREASRQTGIHRYTIYKYCNNQMTIMKDYTWKYIENPL